MFHTVILYTLIILAVGFIAWFIKNGFARLRHFREFSRFRILELLSEGELFPEDLLEKDPHICKPWEIWNLLAGMEGLYLIEKRTKLVPIDNGPGYTNCCYVTISIYGRKALLERNAAPIAA